MSDFINGSLVIGIVIGVFCWLIGYIAGETAEARRRHREDRKRIREMRREIRMQEYDKSNPINGGRALTRTPIGTGVQEKIIDENGTAWYVIRPEL